MAESYLSACTVTPHVNLAVLAYLMSQIGCLTSFFDKQTGDDSLQHFGEVTERLVSTWSTLEQVAFIKTGVSRRSVA